MRTINIAQQDLINVAVNLTEKSIRITLDSLRPGTLEYQSVGILYFRYRILNRQLNR